MKELLFSWLTKPRIELTLAQEVAGSLEIILIAFAITGMYLLIQNMKENKEE